MRATIELDEEAMELLKSFGLTKMGIMTRTYDLRDDLNTEELLGRMVKAHLLKLKTQKVEEHIQDAVKLA